MPKKAGRDYWATLIISNGFLQTRERPYSSFNLTKFHRKSLESDSYSDYLDCCMRTCNQIVTGKMLGSKITLFNLLYFSLFPYSCLLYTAESLFFPWKQAWRPKVSIIITYFVSCLILLIIMDFTFYLCWFVIGLKKWFIISRCLQCSSSMHS